jgi:hypothetical protein
VVRIARSIRVVAAIVVVVVVVSNRCGQNEVWFVKTEVGKKVRWYIFAVALYVLPEFSTGFLVLTQAILRRRDLVSLLHHLAVIDIRLPTENPVDPT